MATCLAKKYDKTGNGTDLSALLRKNNPLFKYLHPNSENLTYKEIQEQDERTWHWTPYKNIHYFISKSTPSCDTGNESNTTDDTGIFTLNQLRHGAVILHFIGVIYFFTLLTVVCNDYFLPAVQCICDDLKISKDVAAATFMATATSTPEFFTNIISTFGSHTDLGLGTVIGSLMFNTLGVAALAGLAAKKPVQLDWWPITRDSILYSTNLIVLIFFSWDGIIYWYEAMVLVILYVLYFLIMFFSGRIKDFVKKYVEGKWNLCSKNAINFKASEDSKQNKTKTISTITLDEEASKSDEMDNKDDTIEEVEKKKRKSLWRIPTGSKFKIFWWFYVWPIKFVLTCTVPSPKTFRKLYPVSFILCIFWIGANSYIIVYLVTIIGITLSIPNTVMGLTFVAAGGCLPEAISSVIMARKGEGGMGVSNSLGANSLAILFSLGVPWLIKSIMNNQHDEPFLNISSYGIEFVILSLVFTVIGLYLTVSIAGFRLRKIVGLFLFLIYSVFVTFAILVEFEVLFPNGTTC